MGRTPQSATRSRLSLYLTAIITLLSLITACAQATTPTPASAPKGTTQKSATPAPTAVAPTPEKAAAKEPTSDTRYSK